jgi:hypothetical protein
MTADTAARCPNCRTAIVGHFCHECSQEATLHPPSAREFLHEFIGHYVALEGKLWKSLWLLLLKPGQLTLEYMEGRRVRYVQPLRLYLTFSLIFFAIVKLSAVNFFISDHGPANAAISEAAALAKAQKAAPREDSELRDSVGISADRLHAGWGRRTTDFLSQPDTEIGHQLSKTFFSYGPYALFALMPVFALLLKILYLGSGRRYGAHLLFALHANAFAFALLSLQIAIPSSWGIVHLALMLWLTMYLPLAMRRVYGGGWPLTVLRWGVLMLLHLTCIGLAIALTLGSAAVA